MQNYDRVILHSAFCIFTASTEVFQMLYYVFGNVAILEPGLAVIDCNGVGYGCRITAYTAGQLKLNQKARLYITESIREDA